MNRILLLLLFIVATFQAAAQNIRVDAIRNPDRPLVIENTATGKTLFFFYPEDFRNNRNYPCQAYECDSRSLQVLRTSPELAMQVSGATDATVRLLCRTTRGDDYYFATENADKCRLYRVTGSSLTLEKVDSFRIMPGERLVRGVSDGPNAYILCTREKKRNKALVVYSISAEGRLQAHLIPKPSKQDASIDDVFRNNFQPLPMESGMEQDPKQAAAPVKMFAGTEKLYVVFDDAALGSDNTGTIAAILKVLIVDLRADSMYLSRHHYADHVTFNPVEEGRSSYIFENRLFQLYFNADEFVLRVRDLETGQSLFSRTLHWADSLKSVVNSPLLVPGQGIFGIEKEYTDLRSFLRRFARFRPFLQVRRSGDHWVMSAGGYDEKNLSIPVGAVGIAPGLSVGLAIDISYERTFNFYTALDAASLNLAPVFYEKPLLEVYSEALKAVEHPRDHSLYRIGGRFYLGYFDKKQSQYRFEALQLDSR